MSSDNIIDRIYNRLGTIIRNGSQRIVNNRAVKLQEEIPRVHKNFFKVLRTNIVDSVGPPDLGEFTPTWKPLSHNTLRRKEKQGRGFYNYHGKLSNQLSTASPNKAFGTPIVSVVYGGLNNGQNVYVRNDSAGRRMGRTADGRRVKLGDIEGLTPRGIEIDLYPAVGNIDLDRVDAYNHLTLLMAHKLKNWKNNEDRPILGPHMKWWLNVEISRVVKRIVRK